MRYYKKIKKINRPFFYLFIFCGFPLTGKSVENIELSIPVSAPLNTPEYSIASTLEAACPLINDSESQDVKNLYELCQFYLDSARGTPEQKSEIVSELSAKNTSTNNTGVSRTPVPSGTNGLDMRLASLRRGTRTIVNKKFSFRNGAFFKSLNEAQEEPGGLLSNKLSAYLNVSSNSGKYHETSTEMGFEDTSRAILLGVDYRLHARTFVGVATHIGNSKLDLADPGSQIDAQMFQFFIYASHFLSENAYAQFSFQGASYSIDMQRAIRFSTDVEQVNEVADGSTSGNQIGFNLSAGYDRHIQYGVTGSLVAALNYQSTSIDAFTEKNAPGYNLSINEQNIGSFTSNFKAALSSVYSTRWGVLIPQVSVRWIHEFDKGAETVSAHFVSDLNKTQFSFDMQETDPNYFVLGINLQALLPHGRNVFVDLTKIQRLRDREQWGIMLGYRQEF